MGSEQAKKREVGELDFFSVLVWTMSLQMTTIHCVTNAYIKNFQKHGESFIGNICFNY